MKLMEIEAFYGEGLMITGMETGIERPVFVNYKSKRKWVLQASKMFI